ncbi:MAG: hypothetical protein PHT79_03180 [Syntrophomonadaceae bacterium]|nr:hypothetical protein [Syntrophomonadaceae bacterium]MDD3888504.1 hypothetical protein [Syntrophomonadaceae bacterium]MDD4548744.1 hypothetical protein [Syntrophomonadaceae bacterium]
MDVNLPGTPVAARQADGVSHAESSRRNIYAFKLTQYNFAVEPYIEFNKIAVKGEKYDLRTRQIY